MSLTDLSERLRAKQAQVAAKRTTSRTPYVTLVTGLPTQRTQSTGW